jgi:GTP-binding protein HflX
MTDTVGFIQKLPHQLVAAFRATLEEVVTADILVHVADASHPQVVEQVAIVDEFLQSLRPTSMPPELLVLNKIDLMDDNKGAEQENILDDFPDAIRVSAAAGTGLQSLLERLLELVGNDLKRLVVRIPFDHYHLVSRFYDVAGEVTQSNYDEGIELSGNLRPDEAGRFEPFLVR